MRTRQRFSIASAVLMIAALTGSGCGAPRNTALAESEQASSGVVESAPVGQELEASRAETLVEAQAGEAPATLDQRERDLDEREWAVKERELAERERVLAAREAAQAAREARSAQQAARMAALGDEPGGALTARPMAPPAQISAAEAPRQPMSQATDDSEISVAEAAEGEALDGSEAVEIPEPDEALDAEREPAAFVERRRERVALTVPAGTPLEIEFLNRLSSRESATGEVFEARVVDDVLVNGLVAIPRGSRVVGHVAEAVPLKKVGGHAKLALAFDSLELPWGERAAIDASFDQQGRSETKRDAATIGGSAAGGAVLGRILGKKKKGTILGAVIGAAIGTAVATNTPGEEVEIPQGTVVGLRLEDWVRVAVEVER